MNLMSLVTVVSLVIAISNGIGMILMFLRYAQVIRGAIMAGRTTEGGEVDIVGSQIFPGFPGEFLSGSITGTVLP